MDFTGSERLKRSKGTSGSSLPAGRGAKLKHWLLLACLLIFAPTTHAFLGTQLYVEPAKVQAKRVSVGFFGIVEQRIPAGGFIKLVAPDDVFTYVDNLTCLDVAKTRECRVTAFRNSFTIEVDYDINPEDQFEFKIGNAIDNPISEKPSDTFTILTSSNEQDTSSELMRVVAKRGRMNKYILTPESQTVGASTTLKVEFAAEHDFPRGTFVFIDFPKWNVQNPVVGLRKPYIQGSEACEPVKILSEDLFCEFKNDRLTVQKAATANIVSNTDVSFTVTGFKNPIQAGYVRGFVITTAILYGNEFYAIDQDETQLSVGDYSTLSSPKLSVLDTEDPRAGMIQELNEMRLDFFLPVPLNPGCVLNIYLPEQYSVDTIESLTTLKAFGQIREYTEAQGNLRVNVGERRLTLNGACDTYIEDNKVATIYIKSLRQPNYEKTTDSFRIFIDSNLGDRIAKVDKKVTFTPQRGSLTMANSARHLIVQETTKVSFELVPEHAIFFDDMPEIIVEFPQGTQIQTLQCQIDEVEVTGYTGQIAEQCFRNDQSFQIRTFLPADYYPAPLGETPRVIKFTVGDVTNALSVQKVDGLKIVIYAFGQYAIDEFEGYIGWMPEQGTFESAKIQFTSPIAYTEDVTYTIMFTPKHLVPQNGYIEIDFPMQISVPDFSYSQSSCRAVDGTAFSTNQIACEFLDGAILSEPYRLRDPATPDHFTMRVMNAFRRTSVPGGQMYALEIPGLRNPIQTVPTFSFKFRTYDQRSQLIDELLQGVQIRMMSPSQLNIVLVSLGSYTNAKLTDYTITMVPTVPIWEEGLIFVTFPEQIRLPDSSVLLDCATVFSSLLKDVRCSYDPQYELGRTVRVDLTFADGVQQIDPLDRFSLTMKNIKNPTTTQTTDAIQVRITDPDYISINSKLKGTVVTTNNANTIARADRFVGSPQPGVESTYTLDFYPENAIKPGGGILVVYPPQSLVGLLQTLTAEVTVDGLLVDQDKLDISFDLSARSVTVKNIVQQANSYEPTEGQKIRVVISGLRTPYTSDETDSFQMTTFDLVGDTFYYMIDKVATGLTINSKCNYPCKDCPAGLPSVCLSCYPSDPNIENGRPYLQVNTCVEQCSGDRYYDLGLESCELCDPKCLSCVGTATTCTSCGIDEYLFLHESQCLTICPDRFIEDPSANRCKKCSDKCLTCEGLPTSCTTCDKQSAYKFFFHDSCIEECLPDISVQVGDQCVECDSTCKTCAGTPQTCTSCEPYMKLDPFKSTCEDICEPERQIFNEQTQRCEFCVPGCSKCAGDINTCTECDEGFVLNQDQTCKKTCSAENQTPVDGVCQTCEEPCYTCEGSVSTCSTCISDYFLYLGSKCVQYCPSKYEERDDVCVYEGLVCPVGFELNQSQDGCIPMKFDCQPGYTINDQKTACIPEPGSAVPFPFLLTALLLCLLVLGSYLKDKHFTKVVTNIIALIGSLEIIMYLMMVIHSYVLEEYAAMVLSLIGLLALLATNILFTAYYRQQIVVKDQVFVKWIHFFPKTQTWLPILILLVNFKFSKMFYSGFYGLESTMARFGRHAQFFYLQRLTAYFSFVFCYCFIFVADIIILTRVKWGYQLSMLAIETLILQLVVVVLTIVEFRKGADALLNSQGEGFAMIKNKAPVRVMGFQDEDDHYDEGVPDIDEDTLIRSKIKTEQLEIGLRQKALARILNQVGKHPTEKGVDIQDCLTKFDQERIKVRRCFSMSGLDSDGSWKADGSEEDEGTPIEAGSVEKDDKFADFDEEPLPRVRRYSFPLSPSRLKNLPNTQLFERQISDIKQANQDFLIDNVYTETKPKLDDFVKRKIKTVSRRTQTYLRELLHVEGEEMHESDMEVLIEEEAEIDFDFAKGLIDNVIEQISSADEPAPVKEKKKKVKKKAFKAKKEIPDFELADIMGDFEIDDMGNFIIMRGEGGELLDQRERLVNRRGYLIDRFGNVINTNGNIIFKAIELDVDDEIPAPFGFEKRKKNLLKLGEANQFKVESARGSQNEAAQASQLNLEDEELLDREVNVIRERSKQTANLENEPTARSQLPDDETMHEQATIEKSGTEIDQNMIEEDEHLEAEIDELVKKKVPRKRKNLKGGKAKKMNNPPPKRIRPEDVKGMFPHLSIEQEEQKRLAKIASSISGLATQLAHKQRQQQLIDDNRRESLTASVPDHHPQQALDWSQLPDEQKLERIRQEQLNQIVNDSEFGGPPTDQVNRFDLQDASFLLQNRPNSGTNFDQIGMARQRSVIARYNNRQSAETGLGLRRHRSSSKPIGNMRDRSSDMRVIYGQTCDLSALDEQEMAQGVSPMNQTGEAMQQQRRGYSGRPSGRLAGLETIYLTKVPKLKPSMNMNVTQSSQKVKTQARPFRPTLDRFVDDPIELNVDTTMHGSILQGGGRDIMEVALKLDQMQRDYLTGGDRAGIQTHKLLGGPQTLNSQQEFLGQQMLAPSMGGRDERVDIGVLSKHVKQKSNPGLTDSQTNSGRKQLGGAPSDANESMKDNWAVPDE